MTDAKKSAGRGKESDSKAAKAKNTRSAPGKSASKAVSDKKSESAKSTSTSKPRSAAQKKKTAADRKPADKGTPAAADKKAASSKPAEPKSAQTSQPGSKRGSREPVRVVAIGASAGGLEPIEQFFDNMPADAGAAIIVIQHLSPDFLSMMDQLIARHSTMSIVHAKNGMVVEPNVVYLNPPRTELRISKGALLAREYTDPETLSLPIDAFFTSLAAELGPLAVGVVMSGTGSDGSRGSLAIHEAGGTVIAQEPASAKFDSMPRSAIERGAAATAALPQEMPALIRQLLQGERLDDGAEDAEAEDDPERAILKLLQTRYGADFSFYKQTTVRRRIRRRAMLNHMLNVEQYADSLQNDPEELESLYCDLLIGVTSFFRDQEAFEALEKLAVPGIASQMSEQRQIRVWIPGCASGEEAYSIAIMFSEFAKLHGLTLNLKIFATDIHFASLDRASSGIYEKDTLKRLPQRLIDDYFDLSGDRYQVKQFLRRLVVFSPQNLIKDPPFTRMDLVSCRNLLIYFGNEAQRKVLSLFHFALRKDGTLFLGPSETTGDLSDEFDVLDKRWRIFRKRRDVQLREWANMLPLSSSDTGDQQEGPTLHEHRQLSGSATPAALERQILTRAYDQVLERYAPPSLLVNRDGELVHVFGDADRVLQVNQGKFSGKVTDLLHPDFKLVVGAGIEQVSNRRAVPFRRRIKIQEADGTHAMYSIGIEYLADGGARFDHTLITFQHSIAAPTEPDGVIESSEVDGAFYTERVQELQRELAQTEESLQMTIEELETSNEELQATNEELMASNEELQSTNEELHSVNEELYTVSSEHQRQIEELSELSEDMRNLLRATDIGTIFLGPELNIRRFTPAAARAFNLVPGDIGRPLTHITYRFQYERLIDDIKYVQTSEDTRQREVDVDGTACLIRILPYTSDTEDNNGVVITIVEVQELKDTQRSLAEQRELFADVVQQQTELICRYTRDGTLTFVNEAYCAYFGSTRDDLLGAKIFDLVGEESSRQVKQDLKSVKPGQVDDVERELVLKDGKKVWLNWHRRVVGTDGGKVREIQAVGTDITALKSYEAQKDEAHARLAQEEERLSQIYRNTPVMLHSILENGEIVEVSDFWCKKMGYERSEVIGTSLYNYMDQNAAADSRGTQVPKLFAGEAIDGLRFRMRRKDGTWMDVELSATAEKKQGSRPARSFAVVFDITDQHLAELELARQNTELKRINDNLNQFTHIVSHDLTGPLRAIEHTAEWIEQDTAPDTRKEIQEHIDRLKDQVGHLGSMLDDLLEYSRAGYSKQDVEKIDLPRALNDIFDVIEKPDDMKLVIKAVPDDLVTFRAPLLLIFRNLVENAIKYHDRDKGKITVRCEDHGDRWEFFVEDDGPGIDPSFHEKIVQPFRKLERKDKVPGNGMGLALVKKAVETNGGVLEIHSNPIERPGTRFGFTWPKRNTHSAVAAE